MPESGETAEDPDYLSKQLVTYLGNKRALLGFIGRGLGRARERLGKDRLDLLDAFSGSGVVARYFKAFARRLVVNDLEPYARVINECYLANRSGLDLPALREQHRGLLEALDAGPLKPGFITELYSARDDDRIEPGERVFYTRRNALFLDTARRLIGKLPAERRAFFLAPLLSEASIHANTSGVFKGFHKDARTGLGSFGGRKGDALSRIMGDMGLPLPLFSRYECELDLRSCDANELASSLPEVDVAYLDPPYNQHPYGSNYFMLNLLVDYRRPKEFSEVSGIPTDWKRSDYNSRTKAVAALRSLVADLRAKFLLVSFNSEGFVPEEEMRSILSGLGRLEVLEIGYNTFKGSRNLSKRPIHVTEFLYLLEKT